MAPQPSSSFFQGAEFPRLLGMFALLGVIGMLIYQAGDARTWMWLTGENPRGAGVSPERPAPEDESKEGESTLAKKTPAPAPAEPAGPTDEDPEQLEAAQDEFQALTDRELWMRIEEMPAYWRLFSWADNQTFAQMEQRATRKFMFNDFVQDPHRHRGKLYEIELNVRRVLEMDAPENVYGIRKVYEVVGFTHESQSWLYWGLTTQLPKGMPIGASINEKATFVGYFFKVQGYQASEKSPRAKPQGTPLFIGRLKWVAPVAKSAEAEPAFGGWWVWLIGGGIAAIGVVRLFLPSLFGATETDRTLPSAHDPDRAAKLGAFLAGSRAGEGQESWEVPEEPWRDDAAESWREWSDDTPRD